MSTSTETMAPGLGPATRPDGQRWWKSCWTRHADTEPEQDTAGDGPIDERDVLQLGICLMAMRLFPVVTGYSGLRGSMSLTLAASTVLVLAGCGSSSSTPPPPTFVAPVFTATAPAASPAASAPPATTVATTSPTVPPAAAATTPATSTADPVTVDVSVVRAHGYQPDSRVAQTPDGFGHTLYAFHGTCTGSGDGYCQIMLFFIGTRYLGTDTKNVSIDIANYYPTGTATFAVTYANYAKSDPLCCPSLQPVTIDYHWNGLRLIASGTPPGH